MYFSSTLSFYYLNIFIWPNQTLENIFGDLSNEISISIIGIMLCWPNINNMFLTSSSVSIIRLNVNLPTESIDGRWYPTFSTLLVFLWLSCWLIWSNWSFRSFDVTLTRTLNNLLCIPPLKQTSANIVFGSTG